ncbi:MAG: class I SAM-dependent methyltransferase [Treponema sp.]|nr:class I SAM-dependent methyltransferase [Treponema sp.]
MDNKVNVDLTKEKETLFITLRCKAIDSRLKSSLLHDNRAYEILQSINYDFAKCKSFDNDIGLVVRAKQIDQWVNEFIAKNENAVVVYLGCGLDTRIDRINRGETVTWFDLDFPEVINIRKSFFSESSNYTMIPSSITDFDWLKIIPNNRPVLIVAEGVLEYIESEKVKELFNRIVRTFGHGEIIFDVLSRTAVKFSEKDLSGKTGAVIHWGINNSDEISGYNKNLRKISEIFLFRSEYMKHLQFKYRFLYGLITIVPFFRKMIRIMKYEF